MAAQSAAEQFSSSSRNAGPAAATRPGPATVEEVTDSPSGGESARRPWRPHARTALHMHTLAGGRGDDPARQSDLL